MFPQHILLNNKQKLTIREAEVSDAEDMLAYLHTVFAESDFLAYGPGEFNVSLDQEQDMLKQYQASSHQIFLLAWLDGELVSIANISQGKGKRREHLGTLAISVKKTFWGMGIGSHMMEHLLAWARHSRMIRKVELYVYTNNSKVIHLYQKYNFVIEGLHTRNVLIKWVFYDAYAMGLAID